MAGKITGYDFCGYGTRNDVKCSDGRIIRQNAFAEQDGTKVPLVWGHQHGMVRNVIGHCLLENRKDGVFCYGFFNNSEDGKHAKETVRHGDLNSLSIFANQLVQQGPNVMHGAIREISLVLAGANPMALIEDVMYHADTDSNDAVIQMNEGIRLSHSETEDDDLDEELSHANDKEDDEDEDDDETVGEVLETLNEKQKKVVAAVVAMALEEGNKNNSEDNKGGKEEMKHNAFEGEIVETKSCLSHDDQMAIISLAKDSTCGTLQHAIATYSVENETLAHGFSDSDLEALFPEYKDVKPGAPELITRDQTWVDGVLNGVHKSPISRIRTRQMDARDFEKIRARGYKKGTKKELMGNPELKKRTTDPQTIYIKDKLERDDIIDITDFDVVQYLYGIMMMTLKEEIALAILIGDQRDPDDADKIKAEHVRPIYGDDPLFTIYKDVDIAAQKAELQGTDTSVHFGDNYVYAEAIITAALYAREEYKGSGNVAFYCTPHLLNVMLLARDLNGRRIYSTRDDLKAALNVTKIETVEQFAGIQRTDKLNAKHNLLGLMVNLSDYQVGSTKGGEITKFEQFDIDFNQNKYLIETRISGALTKLWSAIALEEPVTTTPAPEQQPAG